MPCSVLHPVFMLFFFVLVVIIIHLLLEMIVLIQEIHDLTFTDIISTTS